MITLDTREPKDLRSVLRLLAESDGIQVDEDVALPAGDFWLTWEDRLRIIERKTVRDLSRCVRDGTLFGQLRRCKALGETILLVEGTEWYPTGTRGVRGSYPEHVLHPNAIRGTLLSVQQNGILYVPTANKDDTIATVLWLHRNLKKSASDWSTK